MYNKKGAKLGVTVMLLFFVYTLQASTFHFTSGCIEAQKCIVTLRLNKAEQILELEKKLNPTNAAIAYLENTIDFYKVVTSQNPLDYKSAQQFKNSRFETAKQIPQSSPYYLYVQSEMYLQWGFIKVFQQDFLSSMLDFRSAYQLANQNVSKFPNFLPSQKTIGLFKALLGTTPKNYKWVLNIAGLSGNYEQGIQLIEKYLQSDIPEEYIIDKQLCIFYYGLFTLNFDDKKKAWEFVRNNTKDWETNLMSCYLRAFTANKAAQNEEAINVLTNRPKTTEYSSFPMLDLMLGQYKLYRLDADADLPIKSFINQYKGKVLLYDAYHRLSWFYLINGNMEKYLAYRELERKIKKSDSEEEKNTKYVLAKNLPQNITVLKARLLFDGGYYTKAEETIKQHDIDACKTTYQKQEYYYRYGRIFQEMHKYSSAIEMYAQVIKNSSKSSPYSFAPLSYLQVGIIYGKMGFKQLAKSNLEAAKEYSKAEHIQEIEIKVATELEKLD